MTPFRWRRRMRVISSSIGSSTRVPGDLRIRLPYVVGPQVVQPVEVLSLQPRDRELDQGRRGGEPEGRRRDLDVLPGLLQLPTVHEGPVPDQQDILRPRDQL